jgi:hypothetical protein
MTPVAVDASRQKSILPGAQFADAFQIEVVGQYLDALEATKRAVYGAPAWIGRLLQLRTALVKPFSLKPGASPDRKRAGSSNVGIFPILRQDAKHMVLGIDDRHLDFRLLIDITEPDDGSQLVTATTVVKTHNAFGRAYLAVVMPFHKLIVPTMMRAIEKPLPS